MLTRDDRLRAFLSDPTEVFHSVEHRHEIWKDDPFDVPVVHAEARDVFEGMLAKATTPPGPVPGRTLLLLGDSGAGKTHLLRAFRNYVHKNRLGFVGYLQMTSTAKNYARFILSNLIDSLDQPYDETVETRTGLVRLASVLASRAFEPKIGTLFRDDPELSDDDVADLVITGADRLVVQDRYQCADLDLLRALLYLYRPDPRIKGRIFKYLRCEEMADGDRRRIGGITPRTDEDAAEHMIEQLGRLLGVIGDTPLSLVLCVDQVEYLKDFASNEDPFRRAMTTFGNLAELPSSLIVLCCQEDYYRSNQMKLGASLRDRLERDPEPIVLSPSRTLDEMEQLIAARLRHLYASAGASFDEADPLYPYPKSMIAPYQGLRARDLLEACRLYRERCKKAGKLLDTESLTVKADVPPDTRKKAIEGWEQRWIDYLAASTASPPDDNDALASLLAWAIVEAGEELETGHRFPSEVKDGAVRVTAKATNGVTEAMYVALCNRTAQFGWLARDIAQHAKVAHGDPAKPILVLTRNDDFPSAKTVDQGIKAALKHGGRKVVIQNSDWRAMLALQEFEKLHKHEPFFGEWRRDENHMSRLGSIRLVLDLDHLERFEREEEKSSPKPASPAVDPTLTSRMSPFAAKAPPPNVTLTSKLDVGHTVGIAPKPVYVETIELTCHAAFLGGSGSGKTTAALSLVEQLITRGVPVILVDRKGDLAGYAQQDALLRPLQDPMLDERRKKILADVDVSLFTPGHPEGRPISISIAPHGLADLPEFERDEAATLAAQALGDMLGYKQGGRDAMLRAILIQAIRVLSQSIDAPITLEALIPFVGDADPALVSAVGRLDTKLFGQLVQNLETLKLTAQHLFASGGEPLDVDMFLGKGAFAKPGRGTLTVISTKFLRDEAQVLFWVAQLLMAVLRWASRNPKNELQAAILFDEADMYLPALRQPATKAPLESLLKRGRSAGLGVMLATQSPGDLDYRSRDTIRTWYLGRIKEQTALAKLKPMLAESPVDVTAKLPGQETGEFHLVRAGTAPTPLRVLRSVLSTAQIPDVELLALARRTRGR